MATKKEKRQIAILLTQYGGNVLGAEILSKVMAILGITK